MIVILVLLDEVAAAEKDARAASTSRDALLLEALPAQFPPVPDDLQAEFDAWEAASDEDLARFLNEIQANQKTLRSHRCSRPVCGS